MGDIRIVWDPNTGSGDFAMSGADLEQGSELETAVLISYFTDAALEPGDIVLDSADPRGWWANTYSALEDPALPVIADDQVGSKFWQAFARPRNQDTLNWLRDQAIKALAWMITDGVASAVDATAYFTSSGGIGVRTTITANGAPTIYDYAWQQISNPGPPATAPHGPSLDLTDPLNDGYIALLEGF